MVHCNPRKRDCPPRFRRHLRGHRGNASATIDNKEKIEGFAVGSNLFNLSVGGLNVNVKNRGHANAVLKSDKSSINNDA
jgi:hypothetical protein